MQAFAIVMAGFFAFRAATKLAFLCLLHEGQVDRGPIVAALSADAAFCGWAICILAGV